MTDNKFPVRVTKAMELFDGPYNCAQSVASVFSDVLGKDEEEIKKLMSGFGGGMGGEHAVCGAVTGGVFVISSTIRDPAQREEIYDKVFYLISRFKRLNDGKLNCRDLADENTPKEERHIKCRIFVEQVVREVGKIVNY